MKFNIGALSLTHREPRAGPHRHVVRTGGRSDRRRHLRVALQPDLDVFRPGGVTRAA